MEVNVSRQIMRSVAGDTGRCAEAVHLVHVSDAHPGIKRTRHGKGFEYFYNNEKVVDPKVIKRIKSLVIPPAWENVWICHKTNGHLQATGFDSKNRKQYLYHPLWNALRGKTKFYRLRKFGKALPVIRKKLQKDLKLRGLPQEKVMAALISLMEETNIRIGNAFYEKLYGSFGLSTLKNKNVKIEGSRIRFKFIGKKGVKHDINIRNKKLAGIVRRCREISGKDLFQYYDENESVHLITSEEVNEYIQRVSGSDFTSKDFRTWAGSVECIRALQEIGFNENERVMKKNIVSALDKVALALGNTRSVCKKYYIHPQTLACYEDGRLEKYAKEVGKRSKWMTCEEKILMKILKSKV